MNRIRPYNKHYQVLTNPEQKYNSFEILLGCWTDANIYGFEVKEFETYADAAEEALQYPDIPWGKLCDFHKDVYFQLKQQLQNIIDETRMSVTFVPTLMDPKEIKSTLFARVIQYQDDKEESFRPLLDMNDIISFKITNPWFDNLLEMEKILINQPCLRIFQRFEKFKLIHLIGKTSLGTTYEIVLCPDLLSNILDWKKKASTTQLMNLGKYLSAILKLQKVIDSSFRLR